MAKPTQDEALAAANLELAELREKNRILEESASRQVGRRTALDPEAAKHPNAVVAGDGRVLYRYENKDTGETIICPKPIEEMTENDIPGIGFGSVEQMQDRMPQFLTVKFKDPQWAGHWFNKKARDGYRVGEARSQGWVPAKFEDLSSYFMGLNDKDGAVENHDVVLMKIHKAALYARLAAGIAEAKRKGGVDAYKNQASAKLRAQRDIENDPYYLTPQATGEFQGLGPVQHLSEINR